MQAAGASWGIVQVDGVFELHVRIAPERLAPVLNRWGSPLSVEALMQRACSEAESVETIRRILSGCGVPEADLPPLQPRPRPHQERYFQW